jgi:hypothetical protein
MLPDRCGFIKQRASQSGQFHDIQALFTGSPPAPQLGEFLKRKQRMGISKLRIA